MPGSNGFYYRPRLLFDPLPGFTDGGGGGGGSSAPAPSPSPSPGGGGSVAGSAGVTQPSQPAATPPPAPAQAAQPALLDGQTPPLSGTPGLVGSLPAQVPGQTPAAPQFAGIRDALQRFGVQVPFETDEAAIHGLASAWQQQQQRNWYAEVGQTVAPHLDDFTAWQQERQRTQQAQPQDTPAYNPPQFDRRLLAAVEQDPQTGVLRSKPGYDPRIGQQAQAYIEYVREWEELRTENPLEWGTRLFGTLIDQRARDVVQGHFGQYQEQVTAGNLIEQNRHWLYAHNPAGQAVVNPQTGRPQLSPAGTRYYQYLEHAHQSFGVTDVQKQHQYAMDMLEREALRARVQQAPAVPVPGGAVAQPNVNQLQVTPTPAQPTLEPQTAGLSLIQMMQQGMAQAGYAGAEGDRRLQAEMAEPAQYLQPQGF